MKSFSDQFKDIVNEKVTKTYAKLSTGRNAQEIGDFAAEQIKKRTRLGRGVANKLGSETKLTPLSDKYVKVRQKARRGKASPGLANTTTPKKSNLTRTGQMLDAIISKIRSRGKIFIGFKNSRDDGKNNSDIASYHDKSGAGKSRIKRPFFNISAKDYSKIARFVRKKAREIIKSSKN